MFGGSGADAFSYWRLPHGSSLYAGYSVQVGIGTYRYSPAFAQLISPTWVLSFDAFRLLLQALLLGALVAMAGRWSLVLLVLPPVWFDIYAGNIHLLLGLAIVAGFRWPMAWSFILLTKVTPGIGLAWFAVRREWRSLGLALAATAAIVGVSMLVGGTQLWFDWLWSLSGSVSESVWRFPLPPLWARMALGLALVCWGARTDRRWVVPVAATLALPILWGHGPAMLVALCSPAIRRPGAMSAG